MEIYLNAFQSMCFHSRNQTPQDLLLALTSPCVAVNLVLNLRDNVLLVERNDLVGRNIAQGIELVDQLIESSILVEERL